MLYATRGLNPWDKSAISPGTIQFIEEYQDYLQEESLRKELAQGSPVEDR